jgi:type VI protein secretion system component Hcp
MKCVPIRVLRSTSISSKWRLALLLLSSALLSFPAYALNSLLMRATCGGSLLTAGEGAGLNSVQFEDYVELSSIHHDLSAPLRSAPGGTVSQGPLSIEPIRIVKPTSASSIGMIAAMAQGQGCSEIILENLQFGGASQSVPIWRLALEDAFIVARKEWQLQGDASPVPPQESFELYPSRLIWTHFSVDTQGNVTPVEFAWDFTTNSVP